jgi:phage terminase large subunit
MTSYQATAATRKLLKLNKRLRVVCGGTSAGKTISILTILIDYAQSTEGKLISVVSESFPHLRKGAIRDFISIMTAQGYFRDEKWSKTDFTYTFETGSKIEFFSADQPGKVRGPRRDVLFINECNNVPYETYDQLEVRTKEFVWLDYNPTNEFWYYTEVKDNIDHDFITLTYKDNEALDEAIVESIESRKHNKNWWLVYGLGKLGEVEGSIYTDWNIIEEIPHEARLERRGLDFGYSNHPAAVVDIYYLNGGYIFDERLYRTGMKNRQIAEYLNNLEKPNIIVVADSAEPKSIDEIAEHGVAIIPAKKGPDSVRAGIDFVQDQRISVTKRSTHLLKEYRGYLWATDREGNALNQPEKFNDHLMDAIRYGMESFRPQPEEDEEETSYQSGNIRSLMG